MRLASFVCMCVVLLPSARLVAQEAAPEPSTRPADRAAGARGDAPLEEVDVERVETERVETERVEVEAADPAPGRRIDLERVETERVETERAETERVEGAPSDDEPATAGADDGPLRTPIAPVAPYAAGLAVWATGLGIGLYEAPWSDGRVAAGWADAALRKPVHTLETMRKVNETNALLRTISDGTLAGTVLYTQLIDVLLVPLVQGDVHLAWQATSAHFLALGTALTLDSIAKHATSRERPYGQRLCPDFPELPQCDNGDLYASFFSGHSALSFTSAGTSCALHLSRELYGNLLADVIGCAVPVMGATATGVLRIASDSHFLTDVLVGATVGFLSGYLITVGVVPSRVRVPTGGARASRASDDGASDEPLPERHAAAPIDDVAWMIVPTASVTHEDGTVHATAGAAATGWF